MAIKDEDHAQFNIGLKALIMKNGKLLFLKRRDHHTWELPGGRINKGEHLHTALLRELAEELPQIKQCVVSHITHADQADFQLPNGNNLMLLFFKVTADLPDMPEMSNEHEAACWVDKDTFHSLDTKLHFKQAAERALKNPG